MRITPEFISKKQDYESEVWEHRTRRDDGSFSIGVGNIVFINTKKPFSYMKIIGTD